MDFTVMKQKIVNCRTMDWNSCVICGRSDGNLKCPAKSVQHNGLYVYTAFISNCNKFKEFINLYHQLITALSFLAEVFYANNANWPKSCHLKFAVSQLRKMKERHARKRKHGGTKNVCDNLKKQPRRSMRKSVHSTPAPSISWVFCTHSEGNLHKCTFLQLDTKIRQMAAEMNDSFLIARLSASDLLAINAGYHQKCITFFRNKYRTHQHNISTNKEGNWSEVMHGQVLAELVTYIGTSLDEKQYIFRLKKLHTVYSEHQLHSVYF